VRRESVAADLLWIALAVLVVVGAGIGLRNPWPADEPRFALIARDMVASGDWLFPHVGGDLYQDKPPLYFWLLAAACALTGSVRTSFLLPSLLASFGTLALVYDFVRRSCGRVAALLAAALLLGTLQFLLSARSAQIDATLCLLVTLSLYGLLRHLLYGPAWGWYFAAGVAAGLGVIAKGVGFLPLLVLLPYLGLRSHRFQPLPRFGGGVRWTLAPLGFLVAVLAWLVPMLAAARGRPDLAAYRDEILFHQTVDRYAHAWHHTRPWYYFVIEVIPALWLPLSVLFVWLVPRWRDAWRARDARVWLPLGWALIALVFFSLSPGKRGVYILPALPAVVLASAPFLQELSARPGLRRGGIVWPAVLGMLAIVWGVAIAPAIDDSRSGRAFTQGVLARLAPDETLGFVGYREQFLLYLDRQTVNFGHRRWIEGDQEAFDAARWLAAGSHRVLLVPEKMLRRCFAPATSESVGRTSRENWFLVRGAPAAECARRGDPTRAIAYRSNT
jgi:4-amino-4-deoxy-L-arabinose transferase-like glycosyltransferase